jgi:hypothetical protein
LAVAATAACATLAVFAPARAAGSHQESSYIAVAGHPVVATCTDGAANVGMACALAPTGAAQVTVTLADRLSPAVGATVRITDNSAGTAVGHSQVLSTSVVCGSSTLTLPSGSYEVDVLFTDAASAACGTATAAAGTVTYDFS